VVAESHATIEVDGRDYFPPAHVQWTHLVRTDETSTCPWKGVATYYDVVDGDRRIAGGAWAYEHPSPVAAHIRGHVAFWRGVTIGPPTGDG
jgi:uncharacterized protein (DUF427 family)